MANEIIMLTKNYQVVSTIPLDRGELRTYAKYASQSIERNTTYIAIKVVYYLSYGSLSFDNASLAIYVGAHPAKRINFGYTSISAGEYTMYEFSDYMEHNQQGYVEYGLNVEWIASFGGSGSKNVGITAPRIDRYPMIQTATDFTDIQNPEITYSTTMGFENGVLYGCISTDGETDTVSYRQLTVEDGEYTFNLTTSERNVLRNATPNSNTLPVTFILKTVVGNDNYYSKLQKTMTIVNANPTFTYTSVEQNAKVISMLGSSAGNTLVADVSQLKFTYTPTTYKGATVKNFVVAEGIIGNINQSFTISSSPYEQAFDVTGGTYSGKFVHTLTDSRNNSITIEDNQRTLLQYDIVRILSYSFKRQSQTSSNVIFNGEFGYWGNVGTHTNTPVVKYKLGSGNWVTIPSSNYSIDTTNHKLTITNYTISNILPYTSPGQFSISIEDILTSKTDTSDNGKVLKGVPTFDYGEHDLKVNGDLYVADTNGDNAVNVLNKINNNETKINNTRTYATTETVVGEWLGKPLYRKVINTGALPNATSKLVAHGISNIDRIVSIHGYAYRESGQTTITLPFPSTGNNSVVCDREGTNVVIVAYIDRRNFTESYVTLEYTKTTD